MATALDSIVAGLIKEKPPVSPIADREEPGDVSGDGGDVSGDEKSGDDNLPNQHNSPNMATGGPAISLPSPVSVIGSQADPGTFNPEIHEVDEHGNPVKNANGTYRKRRGRPKGSTNRQRETSNTSSGGIPNTDQAKIQAAYAAGVTTVQMLFILGRTFGGDEFLPILDPEKGIDEGKMMTDAWTQYYLVSGVETLPPWVGVAVATSAYFLTRAAMPKTQKRLGGFFSWLWGKIVGEETDPKFDRESDDEK